ncbi:hypothetical protein KCTCHS21_45480 [Cohnella abietis]|uniref:LSM domain-containing protein n=1 Tax=Cohnella abietis TaxID=2507935 RepID=A0A3T1DAQ5_9BACL|nr:hypothetical protein [Cohnella abietis]BBI35149.1 hypothetical protein KCTCHS21_45480 [Cohnella abietis]
MEMYHLCRKHINCRVRIHTCDGRCYEGVIVNVDDHHVFLRTSGGVRVSAWGFGFGPRDEILTLSLFTLLAIALI